MTSRNEKGRSGRYLFALALIVSLFFLWGVANNLNDILIKQFKKTFELSDFQSGLVQSAFYFGYFVFAMPAAMFMRRFGYKVAVIFGLLLYAAGAYLFYPAAEAQVYGYFLFALFVIASGLAFLETSANPFITVLGPPETAERRLNFAQSFNPLGAIAGVIIGRNFIFSGVEHTQEEIAALSPEALQAYYSAEAQAVQMPYLILGSIVLFWALLVLFARFPKVHGEETSGMDHDSGGFLGLVKFPHFVLAVIAQFFYVGAQVCIWSYLIRYTQYSIPGTPEKTAADYLTYSLIGFMIGRFFGTWLMKYVQPARLMAIFAGTNVLLCSIAIIGPGYVGLTALIATSFFMSIMFPTIFALGIRDLGPFTKSGSSLVIMSIIGGAILTALMGQVSDMTTIKISFLVPLICFVVILHFAISGHKVRRKGNLEHA